MAFTTLKMSGAPFPKASKVTPYENICIKENNDKTFQTKKTTASGDTIYYKTKILCNENMTSRHPLKKKLILL